MTKSIDQIRAEIKIQNIWKEINILVDQFANTEIEKTRTKIQEKIDFKFEEIDELKEVL